MNRTVKELWIGSINAEDGDMLYLILRALYSKLSSQTPDTTFVTPVTLTRMVEILHSVQYDIKIKTVACAILSIVCSTRHLKITVVKKGLGQVIVNTLTEYVEEGYNRIPWSDLDFLYLEQLLHLVRNLCWNCKSTQTMLFDLNILNVLSKFCDPNTSPLFDYTEKTNDYFTAITEEKYLIGKASPLSDSDLKKLYFQQFGETFSKILLPKIGYKLLLYDTTVPGRDLAVDQELIKADLCMKNVKNNDIGQNEPWTDVSVSHVDHGDRIWCIIGGEECLDKVKEVQEIIEKFTPKLRGTMKKAPCVGHFVGGYNENIGYYRGQVVSVKEKEVIIFTFEHGSVITTDWKSIFYLTSDMGLKHIKPQAVPCLLSGNSI